MDSISSQIFSFNSSFSLKVSNSSGMDSISSQIFSFNSSFSTTSSFTSELPWHQSSRWLQSWSQNNHPALHTGNYRAGQPPSHRMVGDHRLEGHQLALRRGENTIQPGRSWWQDSYW